MAIIIKRKSIIDSWKFRNEYWLYVYKFASGMFTNLNMALIF